MACEVVAGRWCQQGLHLVRTQNGHLAARGGQPVFALERGDRPNRRLPPRPCHVGELLVRHRNGLPEASLEPKQRVGEALFNRGLRQADRLGHLPHTSVVNGQDLLGKAWLILEKLGELFPRNADGRGVGRGDRRRIVGAVIDHGREATQDFFRRDRKDRHRNPKRRVFDQVHPATLDEPHRLSEKALFEQRLAFAKPAQLTAFADLLQLRRRKRPKERTLAEVVIHLKGDHLLLAPGLATTIPRASEEVYDVYQEGDLRVIKEGRKFLRT